MLNREELRKHVQEINELLKSCGTYEEVQVSLGEQETGHQCDGPKLVMKILNNQIDYIE